MAKQTKSTNTDTKPNWQALYISFVLENNRRPQSAYELCKLAQVSEGVFYESFGNVSVVESSIWEKYFLDTKSQIFADPAYQTYSVREKLLAFYFTWLENLQSLRSFMTVLVSSKQERYRHGEHLDKLKERFRAYMEELLGEGMQTEEIQNRSVFNGAYPRILWAQCMYVLHFWVKDTSPNFEQSDAAVEKVVNLFFDVAGRTFLDGFADFAKFTFQNR